MGLSRNIFGGENWYEGILLAIYQSTEDRDVAKLLIVGATHGSVSKRPGKEVASY